MPDVINNFGVLLPTRGVLVYANGGTPRVELNWHMAETAERMGYDSVWVDDSITSRPRLEPLTTMAALAARTHRVKIGTAVMLTAMRLRCSNALRGYSNTKSKAQIISLCALPHRTRWSSFPNSPKRSFLMSTNSYSV